MESVEQEKIATETKAKPSAPAVALTPGAKLAANRKANKQRKKKAHRRNLRRSNTTG